MTVKETIEILKTYPEDQFVQIRVWLKKDKDYHNLIQVTVGKIQQSISGAALFTGTDNND